MRAPILLEGREFVPPGECTIAAFAANTIDTG